jgi:hypothetical protein
MPSNKAPIMPSTGPDTGTYSFLFCQRYLHLCWRVAALTGRLISAAARCSLLGQVHPANGHEDNTTLNTSGIESGFQNQSVSFERSARVPRAKIPITYALVANLLGMMRARRARSFLLTAGLKPGPTGLVRQIEKHRFRYLVQARFALRVRSLVPVRSQEGEQETISEPPPAERLASGSLSEEGMGVASPEGRRPRIIQRSA